MLYNCLGVKKTSKWNVAIGLTTIVWKPHTALQGNFGIHTMAKKPGEICLDENIYFF